MQLEPSAIRFRRAEPRDEPALREMLFWAVFVAPGTIPPDTSIVERPELARYVTGWGRSGDDGVIAITPPGDPIAGAWVRLWSEHDHGYGFIDVHTPELSVAVRADLRGRGIGTQALRQLLQRADAAYESVSLSVSVRNPAVRLYERFGFTMVSTDGASMTMRRVRPRDDP
jgi:ribosomal protein S18 acetylase RimI-like enzyme